MLAFTSVSISGLREKVVAEAHVSLPDFRSRIIPSWMTSVYEVSPSKLPSSRPNRTAFAMLPTPDCRGSRFAGMRPFCTSQLRNSRICPAMRRDASSGALKVAVTVGRVGQNDSNDFLARHVEIRRAYPLPRRHERNRSTIGRRLQAVIDVVRPFESGRLPRVDLENHALGLVDPRLVVAERRTGE